MARMQPGYEPVRRERKTAPTAYQQGRALLKGKLFGHPETARWAATPGFRKKISEEDIMGLLQVIEQQGFGFWDTLNNVASSALQVSPHVLPFLL